MKRLVAVLGLMLLSPLALASSATPAGAVAASEPKMLADRAMKYLAANDVKGMFKYIHTLLPVSQAEMDELRDNTISQRKTLPGTLGQYVGYAFISECRKFDQVSRLIFIEKREKNFIRWQFLFYKPREKWQLSAVSWDNKTGEIFLPC